MLRPRFRQYLTGLCFFSFVLLERALGSESSVGAVGRGQAVQETPSGALPFFIVAEKKEESSTGPRWVSCQVK